MTIEDYEKEIKRLRKEGCIVDAVGPDGLVTMLTEKGLNTYNVLNLFISPYFSCIGNLGCSKGFFVLSTTPECWPKAKTKLRFFTIFLNNEDISFIEQDIYLNHLKLILHYHPFEYILILRVFLV